MIQSFVVSSEADPSPLECIEEASAYKAANYTGQLQAERSARPGTCVIQALLIESGRQTGHGSCLT